MIAFQLCDELAWPGAGLIEPGESLFACIAGVSQAAVPGENVAPTQPCPLPLPSALAQKPSQGNSVSVAVLALNSRREGVVPGHGCRPRGWGDVDWTW